MDTDNWSDSCGETSDFEDCVEDEELICLTDSIPKLQFRKGALKAHWDDEIGMAEIVERKGKLLNTMGIVRNGKIFCSIEETLFLTEIGALTLFNDKDTPLSLRDMYEKVAALQYGCDWEAFQTYSHLKSLGYIVGRHNVSWSSKTVNSNNGNGKRSSIKDEALKDACKEVESIDSLFNGLLIGDVKPVFDVYLPNSKFRKSSAGIPSFVVCSTGSNPPSIEDIEVLERQCNDVPLRFWNLEHGRVSFFSFDTVALPALP